MNSRYYDPEIGRFVSIDSTEYLKPESINGLNLYSYCANNPVMRIDPYGHEWWHWLIGALIVLALFALTCAAAGGFSGGLLAVGLALNGVMSESLITTVLAFSVVGAGLAFAASGIVAGLGSIETWATGGSFSDGLNTFCSYGESAMWSTVSGGVIGGIGGCLSYKQQAVTHSWTTERKRYWKNQANNPNSKWFGNQRALNGYAPIVNGHSVQLHHTMGRGGANFYYYIEMTRSQHIAYHQINGYKNFSIYSANVNFWSLFL